MGMSTHVVGFRPPDAKWTAMKDAWESCEAAGVPQPRDVMEFFNHETPDNSGVTVEIEKTDAVQKWGDEMRDGFQVDISKLPEHVTHIRFYNAW